MSDLSLKPKFVGNKIILESEQGQLPVMLICEPKPIFCLSLMPGVAHPMVASEIPELRSFVENYFMLILKLAC